jgi:branched-chain amino acid transport system substrate-binding protein
MRKKITRRDFLKVSGIAGTSLIGGPALLGLSRGPTRAWASTDPIKIGGIYSLSGVVAAWGRAARMGSSMAAQEINEAGGILGRKVVLKFEDDSVNPEVGARKARRLVLDWGADFLHGFNSSGVALGVVPLLEKELKRMCLIPCAASPRITTEAFNKYVFRVHPNCYQIGAGSAAIAAEMPYKKWTVIGPDYSYGWDSWGAFISHLTNRRSDVEAMQVQAWPKFATGDYSSYVTKLLGAKPEGVYSSLWGGDFVTFAKQAKRYGFFEQVGAFMTPAGLALDSFSALAIKRGKESEMPEGLYTAAHGYWFEHPTTQKNKKWVQAFQDRYGEPPHIVAHDAYGLIYVYKKAIEKAGTTETDAVIKAMEGMSFETPGYSRVIRKEDHQAISDVPWGQTAKAPELAGFLGAMRIKDIKDSVGREIIEPIESVLERRAKKEPASWMKFVVKG